jgi:hypothetical protein
MIFPASLLVQSRDLHSIAYLRTRTEYRMRWKFQHACRLQRYSRDSKWPQVFLNVNDFLFLTQENQVDREHHPNGVNPARGNDPKPTTELRPSLGLT